MVRHEQFRSRSIPSSTHSRDVSADTTGNEAKRTGNEDAEQRSLIGRRREYDRAEESADEAEGADNQSPFHRTCSHTVIKTTHASPHLARAETCEEQCKA